ncbi:hypothetical protein [Tepidiforma sp.]|uniref:hypothetical protein n=1 Tax=Tepidiforma sp. TaxID=2682230 RepID=UPI002ADE7570|nr:hypothetical protein [Tepidiforma sp.]
MRPLLRGRAAAGALAAVGVVSLGWGIAAGREGLAMAGGVALAGVAVAYLLPRLPGLRTGANPEEGGESSDRPE